MLKYGQKAVFGRGVKSGPPRLCFNKTQHDNLKFGVWSETNIYYLTKRH